MKKDPQHSKSEPKKKKSHGLFTGIIVGGAIGSVLSLLLSTKEGREKGKKLTKDVYLKTKSAAEKFLEKYGESEE